MKSLFLICFFFVLPAWPYGTDTHQNISEDAYLLIARCKDRLFKTESSDPASFVLQASQSLQRGTVREDTTQTTSRLSNWHFYNTYGNLWQGPILFESMDRIFAKRNLEFETSHHSLEPMEETNELLGRILHYIQDVHVPSHVVPVFHGGPFGGGDEFDHYPVSISLRKTTVQEIDCGELTKSVLAILDEIPIHFASHFEVNRHLLDESARFTLESLRTPIEKSEVLWSYFWREPESQHFDPTDTSSALVGLGFSARRFGTYIGKFGVDSNVYAASGAVVPVSARAYNDFFARQYKHAVRTSAQFILINKMMDFKSHHQHHRIAQ